MRNFSFDSTVIDDLRTWLKNNPQLVKKVFELLSDINKDPFQGIGKPEALKYDFKGCWSRRISQEHRLIYEVSTNGDIKVLSVHGHYDQ